MTLSRNVASGSGSGKLQATNFLRGVKNANSSKRIMSQATRIFLIPTKISKDELKTLEERIQHCGALKSPPAYANTFLTSSKAPKLIASSIRKAFKQEHDEEIDDEKIRSLTVLRLDWLAECENQNITVSPEPFRIKFDSDISVKSAAASQSFSKPNDSLDTPSNSAPTASRKRIIDLDSSDEDSAFGKKEKVAAAPPAPPAPPKRKRIRRTSTPPLPAYVRKPKDINPNVKTGTVVFQMDVGSSRMLEEPKREELDEHGPVTILDHSPVPPFPMDEKEHRFAPQRPSPLYCVNQPLLNELAVILDQRVLTKGSDDVWSVVAYGRAISCLKAFPEDLSTKKPDPGKWAAKNLNGIGPKVEKAISQFYKTGHIAEAQSILNDEAFRISKSLMEVYGVGPVKATQFYSRGYRSAEDIVKSGDNLGTSLDPKECLRILPDLKKKISRKEVEAIAQEIVVEMRKFMPNCEYVIGGSYRRGKPTSSDVDIIFSQPEEEDDLKPGEGYGLMELLVNELKAEGRMTHSVNIGGSDKTYKDGAKTEISQAQFVYLPECHPSSSRPIHRRIDLLITPRRVLGAVIMGWTGSKQFEKDIRRLATEHGYSFSYTGLTIAKSGFVVSTPTEREIFRLLDIPYMPPHMRNCDC